MNVLNATDSAYELFASQLLNLEKLDKGKLAQTLDTLTESSSFLTTKREIQAFAHAITLYIFSESNPIVFPKISALLTDPLAGRKRDGNVTVDDFCFISDQPEEYWSIPTKIIFFEEKGDINLIRGGIFYKSTSHNNSSVGWVQLQTTGKASYANAKELLEQKFETTNRAQIFEELTNHYEDYQKGLQKTSDLFCFTN